MVGLGASAGGLDALEKFLKNVPDDSGLALVVVQHMDPNHKGMMPELLQRATRMKVTQIKDRTRVQPNCVYVIPPKKDLSILHGVLHLLEPVEPRGLRLPIDFFLRSLAQDCGARSVGVILSGMGSDGTLGLRAIRESGGLVAVQDPASAGFDSMPRSATDAGLADIVAPVEELPQRILAFHRRVSVVTHPEPDPQKSGELEKAIILLRAQTGRDFSQYKRSTILRRLERRMGLHQINSLASYVRYLQGNSQELDLLFKEMLIGVTSFFRDPEVWERLGKEIIPEILALQPASRPLRAWVPGCSTGEEAYSLGIVLLEALEKHQPKSNVSLQIFATDLDSDAIDKARQGTYPINIESDVSPERLRRFFTHEEGRFRIAKGVRERVTFAVQDLIMDPPFTKLDILSCRNLLIYLGPEMQRKLIPLFHYSLKPGGLLVLGSAETIGNFTDQFTPVAGKQRIFRRTPTTMPRNPVEFASNIASPSKPSPDGRPVPVAPPSLQTLADQLVLQRYAPPSVLVNEKGDIFYICGRTGKYLEPAAGKANWNLFAMAREGLRYELSNAFQKVLRDRKPVRVLGVRLSSTAGEACVDIAVCPLEEAGPLEGLVMIVFSEAPAVAGDTTPAPRSTGPKSNRVRDLEHKLHAARALASTIREQMQTSQEELRSANEELQSTNEELQSTNEEITTSKEEMQSLNEELQTVNAELQIKVDELSRSHNDMKNLLNSTDIATLFLDNDLHVRRYTEQATRVIRLIPGDVGRPVTDLDSQLQYTDLTLDARRVLQSLIPIEKVMEARDQRWFSVRIMPYRTLDNQIDGVVITFSDVTVAKLLEAELRKTQAQPPVHNGAIAPSSLARAGSKSSRKRRSS